MHTKKFTLLHSNDMHGDLLTETKENKKELIGGLALLSGYVNQVRQEEEHVLYVIAGDMVQGSLIDSEYKGISTIEIVNYLSPDVVCLGNHEFDYGLPHLLLLEKMANFPIVNANLYIKLYQRRLMRPYVILEKAGFKILFTGIITDKIIDSLKQDELIGSLVSLEEASAEIGKITNAYKQDDIDLTIVLTHIGHESDIKLAKLLKPEWGVDMIIGGHTHTVLDKPPKVNNILIAQAGSGTNCVGRFDLVIDDDTNSIVDYTWQMVEITDQNTQPDLELVKYLETFKQRVDEKYSSLLTTFSTQLTHPQREIETTLGNLLADIFAENAECDVMFLGAGSVRVKEMGPKVTLGDLKACFPYDDSIRRFTITGTQLKTIFTHIMRESNRDGEGECYQVNHGVQAIYNDTKNALISLTINNQPVQDIKLYRIAMQGFHFKSCDTYLNITTAELEASGQTKVVTTSAQQVLEEYFSNHHNISSQLEGRLIYQ